MSVLVCVQLLGYYDEKIPPTPPTKEPQAGAGKGAAAGRQRSRERPRRDPRQKQLRLPSQCSLQAVRAVLLRMKAATVLEVPALIDEALALCA